MPAPPSKPWTELISITFPDGTTLVTSIDPWKPVLTVVASGETLINGAHNKSIMGMWHNNWK